MTLTLYSRYQNSAGERVRIALALKDIPYDYVAVGSADGIKSDGYKALNPQALLPALQVGSSMLPQATAILEYLEEMFPEPSLLPDDAILRAQARGFAQHIVSEMHAIDVLRVRRFLQTGLHIDQVGIDAWQTHWFAKGLSALETILERRDTAWRFCFGDAPGWADLHLIPHVRKGLTRLDLDLSPYPHISQIHGDCSALPAFIAASPEKQPDFPHSNQ